MFGWYLKNIYLCIRFPKESPFKEEFFERFTINNKVVQAYIILYIGKLRNRQFKN